VLIPDDGFTENRVAIVLVCGELGVSPLADNVCPILYELISFEGGTRQLTSKW